MHKFKRIRSALDWPRACCSSSCANIICFNSSSWTSSKSSSIWPESGLKRRSPGLKKHMLIRSTIVRIRTWRYHFWSSSVLVELQQIRILVLKYEEMERDWWPFRRSSNNKNISNKNLSFVLMFWYDQTFYIFHYFLLPSFKQIF